MNIEHTGSSFGLQLSLKDQIRQARKAEAEHYPVSLPGRKEREKENIIDPLKAMSRFEVTKEYVDKLGKEEFLYPNLIIKNHVVTIIAMPGGAKTTFLFYVVAPHLAKAGATVWYMDADSPASDHPRMKETADRYRFRFINPDVNQGTSVESFLSTLEEIAESHADLSGWVLIIDTLKKVADLMSKQSVKECYKLARKLSVRGATVVFIGHANKYRDKDGNLVFEGTGDVRADTDELIYFERTTNPSGGIDVTTVVDPDRMAKTRGLFEPFSFHVSKDREVKFYDNPLATIDFSATTPPKATDDAILEAAEKYIKDKGEPVSQPELVEYVCDTIEGAAGKERVRKLIVKRAVLNSNFTLGNVAAGVRFIFEVGAKGKRLFEGLPEPPKQKPLFGEDV